MLQQITCKSDTTTMSDVVPHVENPTRPPSLSSTASLLLLVPLLPTFAIAFAGLVPLATTFSFSASFSSPNANRVWCCAPLSARSPLRWLGWARVGLTTRNAIPPSLYSKAAAT